MQKEKSQTLVPRISDQGATLAIGQAGTWLAGEELQQLLLARVTEGGNTLLDCAGIEHLDACTLQLLLAFLVQEQSAGASVGLSHVSTGLAQWFKQAGATSLVELVRLAEAA